MHSGKVTPVGPNGAPVGPYPAQGSGIYPGPASGMYPAPPMPVAAYGQPYGQPPPMGGYPGAGSARAPGQPMGGYPGAMSARAPMPGPPPTSSSASRRPKLPNGLSVTCPMVCALNSQYGHCPLPILSMTVTPKCQISVAFVGMEIVCALPADWQRAPLQFLLPKTTHTTVTQLYIENTMRDSVYATAVVPADEAERHNFKVSKSSPWSGVIEDDEGDEELEDDPELFVLPLPTSVQPGDHLKVVLSYFEPLTFDNGQYVLHLPTEMPAAALAGRNPFEILKATFEVNTGAPVPVHLRVSSSHGFMKAGDGPGHMLLTMANSPAAVPNADIIAGYQVWAKEISPSLNVTPPEKVPPGPDPRGTFMLSVSPPAPETTPSMPRSLVFVLDRSGSMDGDPMEFARRAITFGLSTLTPQDEFSVVAFDHEQMWFRSMLVPGTADNKDDCIVWLTHTVTARGLTDIMNPVQGALNLLRTAKGLPLVFLITDGCVDNEKDIANYVEQCTVAAMSQGQVPQGLPRISTFAIGPYANHYFLKQLALAGRGLFDVAFKPHGIHTNMQRMLMAAQKPVLTDITISLPGVAGCELYPYPIPDLSCGNPLVIAGKYEGTWPEAVTISGKLPDGTVWTSPPISPSQGTAELPLDTIYIKSRLDMMTSKAWLAGDPPPLVNQIVGLSMATGVPCAHTRVVGFECTHKSWDEMQQAQAAGRTSGSAPNYTAYAIGGAAGILVLAGIGAALTFGDLGATLANVSLFGAAGMGAECCAEGCCEGCDATFEDCGDLLGACVVA